jgi:hypothetical protein
MPLILAVEPDSRQAHQLTAVVRGRLRAELVLADSAEAGLAALGDRVPDLILTSALLSAKDETVLADWLRNSAAAHVQTLTIPVLESPAPRSHGRGGIFSLRGDRTASAAVPDGCDPAVFAEQCAAYLGHAVTAREPVESSHSAAAVAAAADQEAANAIDEPAAVEDTLVAQPPPPPQESIDESAEIDLSAMLDESVFKQLSAAIETVSRDSARSSAAARSSGDVWTPSSLGSPAKWPAMDLGSPAPPSRSHGSGRSSPPAKRFPGRRPLQDEWGFFDPAQCGFSALLARLDEITHVAPPLPAPKPPAGSSDLTR